MIDSLDTHQIRLTTMPRWYRCEPTWRWQPPPLRDYDLWYVAGGKGQLRFDGQMWDAEKNDCFVIPPGTRILGTQDPIERFYVFAVHFEWVGPQPGFVFPDGPINLRDWSHFKEMSHWAERTYARGDDLGRVQSTAWVHQMLLHLQAELTLPPLQPADAAIEQIIAEMRQEPGASLSLPAMAARAHLSPSQFARRFQAFTGMAPRHFQIHIRLERARQLLEETDMTLEHIAGALGYSDHFFFARQYKRWMNETPGSTRRSARGQGD